MNERLKLKVGDAVVWESGAGGKSAKKWGLVVAIVAAGVTLDEVRGRLAAEHRPDSLGWSARLEDSYVVYAQYRDSNGQLRTAAYWPLAGRLRKVDVALPAKEPARVKLAMIESVLNALAADAARTGRSAPCGVAA